MEDSNLSPTNYFLLNKSTTSENKLQTKESLSDITKLKQSRYGVVIIARNEEKTIGTSLDSLLNQTLKPQKIIVVDDGSTDKTFEIASSFKNVSVIHFNIIHDTWLSDPNLASVFNFGIQELDLINLDYVVLSASDIIYPEEYCQSIISSMNSQKIIGVGGGIINNERCHRPRGAGRIVRTDLLKSIGNGYPIRYGYEGYLLLKAEQLGFKVQVFPIPYKTIRKTGTNHTKKYFYHEGKATKALGYSRIYVSGKFLLMFLKDRKNSITFLKGYLSDTKKYEKELRIFNTKRQKEIIFHKPRLLLYRLLNR